MTEWIAYDSGATYVECGDGTVVAYGDEVGTSRLLMIASGWSAHPLLVEDARHLGHLCVDAELKEWQAALDKWADEHGGLV